MLRDRLLGACSPLAHASGQHVSAIDPQGTHSTVLGAKGAVWEGAKQLCTCPGTAPEPCCWNTACLHGSLDLSTVPRHRSSHPMKNPMAGPLACRHALVLCRTQLWPIVMLPSWPCCAGASAKPSFACMAALSCRYIWLPMWVRDAAKSGARDIAALQQRVRRRRRFRHMRAGAAAALLNSSLPPVDVVVR